MTDVTTRSAPAETTDYPAWWNFDENGDTCAGTFVRFEQGQTRGYGKKVIAILEVDGTERSVWLNETVLHNQFKDELADRLDRNLVVGERVIVTRLGMKKTASSRGEYRDFRVLFPDRPAKSASDLFGLDESQAGTPEDAGPPEHDGIPF